MRRISIIGLILIVNSVSAQNTDQTAVPANAALQLLLIGITKTDRNLASPDQITGSCIFEGSDCVGAQINLLDLEDGKVVSRLTINMDGNFSFTNLKRHRYRLEIDYPRYKAAGSSDEIVPGTWLAIEVKRRK